MDSMLCFLKSPCFFPPKFWVSPLSHIKCPHALGSACHSSVLFTDPSYLRFVKIAVTHLWARDSGSLSCPSTVQSQPNPEGKAQTERFASTGSGRGPRHRTAVDITADSAAQIIQQLRGAQQCLQSGSGQPVHLVLGKMLPPLSLGHAGRLGVYQSVLRGFPWNYVSEQHFRDRPGPVLRTVLRESPVALECGCAIPFSPGWV